MKLSNKEIYMLSDGLLALINNASEAIKLTNNEQVQFAINDDIRKYQKLNSKLMRFIEKQPVKAEIETIDGLTPEEMHEYFRKKTRSICSGRMDDNG